MKDFISTLKTIWIAKRDKEWKKGNIVKTSCHIRNESLRSWGWQVKCRSPYVISIPIFIFLPTVTGSDGKSITFQIVHGFLNSLVAVLLGSCKSDAQCFLMCHAHRANISCGVPASSDSHEMRKEFSWRSKMWCLMKDLLQPQKSVQRKNRGQSQRTSTRPWGHLKYNLTVWQKIEFI